MSAQCKNERRPRGELARVLVVDDEADIRELLDLTMARMGLSADCAGQRRARRGSTLKGSAISCAYHRHAPARR
jgi:two-component system response regulator PilR (NtrC family)